MTISIHQPQYLPWIPYFSKIKQSDVFVFLDDVQFQKNGLQNRNYILSKNGETRLTLPVSYDFGDAINIVKISDKKILKKHWQTIEHCYKKSPFFNEVAEMLAPIYNTDYELLCDLNRDLLFGYLDFLGIKTKTVISSGIEKRGEKSDLILSICNTLGARNYLTGSGGMEYLDMEDFKASGITIELLKYDLKEYRQINNNGVFVPHLSLMDLVFNEGKASINFI